MTAAVCDDDDDSPILSHLPPDLGVDTGAYSYSPYVDCLFFFLSPRVLMLDIARAEQ